MKSRSGLPVWARMILRISAPAAYRDALLGDIEERWMAMGEAAPGRSRWLLAEVMGGVVPGIRARTRGSRTRRGGEGNTMETILQDLRYAVRSLARTPAFSGMATLTLAIAIGVTTAIFSIVNVVAFSELPWENPDDMAFVWSSSPTTSDISLSYPNFVDIRDRQRSFEGLAALEQRQWVLTGAAEPRRIGGFLVTANLPTEWGIAPVVGRAFSPDEDRPGAQPVVMLAHWVWDSEYGGSADVVGEVLRLDGVPHTIIGVMPPALEFGQMSQGEVWVPMRRAVAEEDRAFRAAMVSGRLLPGVSVERASADIAAIGAALVEEYPGANQGRVYEARSARNSLLGDQVKMIMILLVGSVTMVLLIACANVANMLLARGSVRARELAVRSVLGAGRRRLIRQLLTESLVLTGLAAALGVLLATGLMDLFVRMTRGNVALFNMAELDGTVLRFVMLVTLATPLVFGLVPALRASAGSPADSLKDRSAGSGGGGRSGSRMRGGLVGAQVAFAVMLMIGASLSARSIGWVRSLAPGFDVEGLLTAQILRPDDAHADAELVRFFEDARREIEALPTARGAAFTSALPLVEPGRPRAYDIEGSVARVEERPTAATYSVTEGFFGVAGIPLLQGRAFRQSDDPDAPPVLIVNRAAAERHWPGSDPLGGRVRVGDAETGEWRTVIGVVGNVARNRQGWEHAPELYVPFAQMPQGNMAALVRTSGEVEAVTGGLREALWAVDAGQPVEDVKPMTLVIDEVQSVDSVLLMLFGTFAIFALAMSALGLYGVVSYAVSRRTGEIGIRMALGAERNDVRRMVLGQGARPVLVGGAIGLLGAFLLTRLIQSLVVGVSAMDPLTWLGVPAVLALAALAANLVPALRATRVEPMRALRTE